jgi:hypothetical protein
MEKRKYVLFALNILREENFVELSDVEIDNLMMNKNFPQENLLLRKDAFRELSEEAKEVIEIILHIPAELLMYSITEKYGFFSLKRFRRFMRRRNGWTRKKTLEVFRELREYSKEIVSRI